MPETMVERVGRAIAEANGHDYELYPKLSEALARAALRALREPTEAMVRANGTSQFEEGRRWLDEDARITWQAMVDAALSEGAER